jgi:hypothetical protein
MRICFMMAAVPPGPQMNDGLWKMSALGQKRKNSR